MKNKILYIFIIPLFLISLNSYSQDTRVLETKIADLLARLPAIDVQATDKLMNDMLSLGEEGMIKICDQIIPPGTDDDTKPRFAVESFSRFLSQKGMEKERTLWEEICISRISGTNNFFVNDFFIKQLQLIGGDRSVEALSQYLKDADLCIPAVAAITAVGGQKAENRLAESLKDKNLPCAAAVMNALAAMNSQIAVSEYIGWTSSDDPEIKASAYNALAVSRSKEAYNVLMNASKSVQYRWERTGAVSALLTYAENIAAYGDLKTMDKICKFLIKQCNDELTMHIKSAALKIYVTFHGTDAMPLIIKAVSHENTDYRNAAINISKELAGSSVTDEWIKYFPKAIPEAKAEIIRMLGTTGDKKALPLIKSSLISDNQGVREAAAGSLIVTGDTDAVPLLIGYMMEFESSPDQEAAKTALMSLVSDREMPLIKNVLQKGPPAAKETAIELIAWKKDKQYFADVLPFTSSSDEKVRAAAFNALASLAGPRDQDELIRLLFSNGHDEYVTDIQDALAAAALQISDPERRSEIILKVLETGEKREELIPVLALTGGREALAVVLKEFENGTAEIRQICFNTLTSWIDHSASSALFEICASGNKNYEIPAFDGYVRQVRSASVADEQKLLLLRKIMPYALTDEQKNKIIREAGRLKTYQALSFVAGFLDEPETGSAAARAAMTIALPASGENSGLSGTLVKEILEKVIPKLEGQETDYDREMVRKYIETMSDDEGFVSLFNGKNLDNWIGNKESYVVEDGMIVIKPDEGSGGNLYTEKEYADFIFSFEFQLTPAANNGLGIRAPLTGDAAYQGMELQILDNTAPVYAALQPYQYHGSVYGVIPAKRGYLNPVGEWNYQEVFVQGTKIKITLNGTVIVDGDIADAIENGTMDHREHPGLKNKTGHIGFLGHGSVVKFRNIRIKELSEPE